MRQAVLGVPHSVSDIPDVLRVARALHDTGMCLDGFARGAHSPTQADEATTHHLTLLEELRNAKLAATTELSVSLDAIGVTSEQALSNAMVISAAAVVCGSRLTLDTTRADVDATLAALTELDPSTGITLHSGLARTVADCIALADTATRVRLVRGGNGDRHGDDLLFVRCLRLLMRGEAYVMVATSDPRLLSIATGLARQCGRSRDDWEIHLPYGDTLASQRLGSDQRVRIDVTFGAAPPSPPSFLQRMARQLHR